MSNNCERKKQEHIYCIDKKQKTSLNLLKSSFVIMQLNYIGLQLDDVILSKYHYCGS